MTPTGATLALVIPLYPEGQRVEFYSQFVVQ